MASVIRQKTNNGIRYLIQLSPGENETRPKISLGEITKGQAEAAKLNIENVIKCKNTGAVASPAMQEWLAGISDGLRKRLTVLGIVEKKKGGPILTVTEWAIRYMKSRPDVKEITKGKWENAVNKLSAFFRGQNIEDVTTQQAKDFRVYLKTHSNQKNRPESQLSENTVRRLIGLSRQFFKAAVDAGLLTKNPFAGQSIAVRANPSRFYYVGQEMALKVLDACPDAQWRLIFALARWGGLRCPSEVLRLEWQDVDFEHNRFTVHACKTEHHADSGIRAVPMFPELRPLFQDAFDKAIEGDVYCITRYRDKSVNLRTSMSKIIVRAGFEVWPKIFQNLRSTRETELFKMTNGNVKAVCSWIGNSPEIAMQHYAQVTEADIQEAAKLSLISDAESRVQQKTVHNPVQTTDETNCTEPQEEKEEPAVSPSKRESKREFATLCENKKYPQGESNPCLQDENLIS
jgi:integrase